jgi:hypothetical protein
MVAPRDGWKGNVATIKPYAAQVLKKSDSGGRKQPQNERWRTQED